MENGNKQQVTLPENEKNIAKNQKDASFKLHVPEVRNIKQSNLIFRENEKNELPFLIIRKACKYATIEYDFIATYYQLKEEPREKVQKIFEEMIEVSLPHKPSRPVVWSTGKIFGVSKKCELDICRDYAALVKNIVFNKKNWEFSKSGRYKKQQMKEISRQC
ncbi:hypothetical protein [uncultured Methanobacterium sp.]|uniref:hypothetical protein n=1 Tax=uncultured Methanobacterium sp. TaxID=176306 RepID=UPI0028051ABF|nr:hypothetical protein [uncultured Methanobacterium sp.]